MSIIPLDEFIERVKRLLVLFPNRKHQFVHHIYGIENIVEKATKHGIMTNYDNYAVYFIPPGGIDVNLHNIYYDPEMYQTLTERTFHAKHETFGVYTWDINIFKEITADNNYIPKLQCDILTAIYGQDWPKYITIKRKIEISLIAPVLEKLM